MNRKQWQRNWRKLLAWRVKCVIYCMYSDLTKLFELSFSIWAHKVCSVFLETMTRCHVMPVMWIKSFVQRAFFTTDIWTSYLLVTSHSKESTTVTNKYANSITISIIKLLLLLYLTIFCILFPWKWRWSLISLKPQPLCIQHSFLYRLTSSQEWLSV